MKRQLPPIAYPLIALALLLVFNALMTPGFFAIELRDGRMFGSLIDVLNRAAPVMLVSLGMTLVIATGGVDLSVGAVMAIAGAVAAVLVSGTTGTPISWIDVGGSAVGAVFVALLFSLAAGAFNGLLVGRGGVQPIVATLVLMVAGRGVAQLLTSGQIVIFNNPSLERFGNGAMFGLPMPVVIFVVVCVALVLLVRRTALGLFIEAVGSNSRAAHLTGLPTNAIKTFAYSVSGLVAGIAGVIACANIRAADSGNAGLYVELDAILAVCIGGTSLAGGKFSIAGSIVGAIVMQTLTTTILMRGVSPHATLVAKALIVVAVVLLQSPSFRAALRPQKRAA